MIQWEAVWQYKARTDFERGVLTTTYNAAGKPTGFAAVGPGSHGPLTHCVQASRWDIDRRGTESVFGYGYSFDDALRAAQGAVAEAERREREQ